jgi:transposase
VPALCPAAVDVAQREARVFAGVDSHKDTLAVAVIDAAGRTVTVRQVANEPAGFTVLADLVAEHAVVRVGIEGSTNFGWAAAMHLVAAGAVVVEVPPLLTSRERQSRPGQGKTDPVDAVAIARITAREAVLPPVRPMGGLPAELRVLMDYREQLIAERTALANRIHADLGWLRPGYQRRLPRLTQPAHLQAGLALLENDPSVRASVTRRRLHRMIAINAELTGLRIQIAELVQQSGTTLTGIYGVGVLVAARILAEVVDVGRYPTRHAFAAANGSAPIPASSGRTVRHRLNRGGNRQLNRALYTIAITEIRADTEGRAYYERKRAEGKTSREALRCLKRRLSDVVYRTLRADQAETRPQPLAATAA